MEFNNYIKILDKKYENKIRAARLFEMLTFKLLEKYLEEKNKKIKKECIDSNIKFKYDAVIKGGFKNLPGDTAVEVKYLPQNMKVTPNRFLKILNAIKNSKEINSLLLILGRNLSNKEKLKLSNFLKEIKHEILDLKDLENLTREYSEYASSLINNLSNVFINNVIKESLKETSINWEDEKEEYINELKRAYKNDDLVLMLGAGVSKDAGVPNWNNLVSDLLVKMLSIKLADNDINLNKDEQQKIVNEIQSGNNNSPLLLARYIRTGLEESFNDVLKEILYQKFNEEYFGKSKLLQTIADLCLPRRNGIGIRSVVNYNFDDLLEKNLDDKGVHHSSIYREIDTPGQNKLGIYHVHGYLPRDEERYEGLEDNLLVFSEEGYHSVMRDPYSWSNITQLNFLRENTCLLIGLSATDPNLRRLLSIASRNNEEANNYIIFKRPKFSNNSNNNIRDDVLTSFSSVDKKVTETSFQELGLNIIWVEEYEEIPEILNSINNSV